MSDNLATTGYLKLKRRTRNATVGDELVGTWSQSRPSLEPDEIAVRVTVAVPPRAFATQIYAEVTVPEADVIHAHAEADAIAGGEA